MSLVRWSKDEQRKMASKGGGPPPRTITLAAIESLSLPLVQEVVFLADFRCAKCQRRVAEVMSKMNGETQSVVISVLEKKVTLTCTYEYPIGADNRLPAGPRAASVHRSYRSKIARLFPSSCT